MPSTPLTAEPSRVPHSSAIAGVVLLFVTLLEIVAMAHHPTVATVDIGQAVEHLGALSRLSGLVHGVLIASMLLTLYGISEFAVRRGLERPLVRAGAIAYCAGVLVMLGAALVSGFVIGDVASLGPHDLPMDLQITRHVLVFCGILNQACANVGVVAMSVGIGCWSIDLLRDRGPARWIGALGCLAGIVPAVALLGGMIRLDVRGMRTVVLIQACWTLAIAGWLLHVARRSDLRAAATLQPDAPRSG